VVPDRLFHLAPGFNPRDVATAINTDWVALCAFGFQALILPVVVALRLAGPVGDILDLLGDWWMDL